MTGIRIGRSGEGQDEVCAGDGQQVGKTWTSTSGRSRCWAPSARAVASAIDWARVWVATIAVGPPGRSATNGRARRFSERPRKRSTVRSRSRSNGSSHGGGTNGTCGWSGTESG